MKQGSSPIPGLVPGAFFGVVGTMGQNWYFWPIFVGFRLTKNNRFRGCGELWEAHAMMLWPGSWQHIMWLPRKWPGAVTWPVLWACQPSILEMRAFRTPVTRLPWVHPHCFWNILAPVKHRAWPGILSEKLCGYLHCGAALIDRLTCQKGRVH